MVYVTLNKLYFNLFQRHKKQFLLVLGLAITASIIQTLGVGSILPLLSVLMDPSLIESNQLLSWLKESLGIIDNYDFILFFSVSVLVVFCTANLSIMLNLWLQNQFSYLLASSVSKKLFRGYLQRPYEFYLNQNSATLLDNLTAKVDRLRIVILHALELITKSLTIISMLTFLLFIQPYITLLSFVLFGSIYWFIYWFYQTKMQSLGAQLSKLSEQRVTYYKETLNSIKELTILGNYHYYYKKSDLTVEKLFHALLNFVVAPQLPKYIIEICCFSLIIILAIIYLASNEDITTIIPYLAIFTFAGYRLIPIIQGIFQSITILRVENNMLCFLFDEIESNQLKLDVLATYPAAAATIEKHPFKDNLIINNVSYRYPGSNKDTIKNISFTIEAGKNIGILGENGAGKSTLASLITGLLPPTDGELLIDGQLLTSNNIRRWQDNIGYIPQNIFFVDASIAKNIALGISDDEIDINAVMRAAKMAHLHDFIVNDLPDSYNTRMGESGIRLSGGQCQRIGIARALYRNPKILVLDEATSAVDTKTEQMIVDELFKQANDKTILIIAHRLSALQYCDEIITIENGSLADVGSYEKISNTI